MIEFKILFPGGYNINDMSNDNIDLNIILSTGDVFFGTLFTLSNIQFLMTKEDSCFFWATDMVIVKDLKRSTIFEVVDKLVKDDDLKNILTKIGTIEHILPWYNSFGDIPHMAPIKF